MRAQEFIRQLADLLNQKTTEEPATSQAVLTPVAVDNTDDTEASAMIPPLQQKLELLKKSVGVTSAFNDGEEEEFPDELEIIKRSAGITPTQMNTFDPDIETD